MDIGLVFALLSAVGFAVSTVFTRKGVARAGESFTAVAISVFIGVPFFAATASLSGEWSKLWSLSVQGFILLGLAGIIHFIAGRILAYNALRLIGATKSTALLQTIPFYTLILGVLFLNELLTISLALGILCIFTGAALVSIERKSVSGKQQEKQRWFTETEVKGILSALGGAIFWGISPILIRTVAKELGSPSVAAFVSHAAASIIMACFFFRRQHREQSVQLRFSGALTPLVIGGIFNSVAQLCLYAALSYSPASMVSPLVSTAALFVFLFSFFINRNIEVFTWKVFVGMVLTLVGAFLISYF